MKTRYAYVRNVPLRNPNNPIISNSTGLRFEQVTGTVDLKSPWDILPFQQEADRQDFTEMELTWVLWALGDGENPAPSTFTSFYPIQEQPQTYTANILVERDRTPDGPIGAGSTGYQISIQNAVIASESISAAANAFVELQALKQSGGMTPEIKIALDVAGEALTLADAAFQRDDAAQTLFQSKRVLRAVENIGIPVPVLPDRVGIYYQDILIPPVEGLTNAGHVPGIPSQRTMIAPKNFPNESEPVYFPLPFVEAGISPVLGLGILAGVGYALYRATR